LEGEEVSGSLVDEGVGVGEVGGSHWFAEENEEENDDQPSRDAKDTDMLGKPFRSTVDIIMKVSFLQNGCLDIDWSIDTHRALPSNLPRGLKPSLPRVGVQCAISRTLETLQWYGNGPQESYPDRKAGTLLQQHSASVQDLHVPYIFPSECGGRTDVRWARFVPKEDKAKGMFLAAVKTEGGHCKGVHIAASLYSLHSLDAARHNEDLADEKKVFLHLDAAHMGVGGDDSWSPSVHSEFLVPPKAVYTFRMILGTNDVQHEAWSHLISQNNRYHV